MIETGLHNKVVLVTGAASGIGRATAARFAAEGCRVVSWDVIPAEAHPNGLRQQVDVSQSAVVNAAVEEVIARFGTVDVLVNNAGILRDGQLVKWKGDAVVAAMSDEQFDTLLSVNLRGVFVCTRAVAPHMIRARRGVILNASSVVGLYGNFGQTNYVASKAGVVGMTRVWARELGRYGIRVNAVAPGLIATEILAAMPETVLAGMREHTPLGRLGDPAEVANAYLWLASDGASFITGTVLSVDGGIVTGT